MPASDAYDVVVIGAGAGGMTAAAVADMLSDTGKLSRAGFNACVNTIAMLRDQLDRYREAGPLPVERRDRAGVITFPPTDFDRVRLSAFRCNSLLGSQPCDHQGGAHEPA